MATQLAIYGTRATHTHTLWQGIPTPAHMLALFLQSESIEKREERECVREKGTQHNGFWVGKWPYEGSGLQNFGLLCAERKVHVLLC